MVMAKATNMVAGLVALSVKRPLTVALTYAVLFVAALAAAASYLEVNTDARGMLNLALPFQQRTVKLEDAFPHVVKTVAVTVESTVPDAADAVSAAMTQALTGRPGVASVFAGSVDPFFLSHGALYADAAALGEGLGQLNASADLLAAVRKNPDSATLFAGLATINRQAAGDTRGAETLDRLYGNIAGVLEARAAGEPTALSWQALLAPGTMAAGAVTTRIVEVMPELDYTALQPAETALTSIRAAIAELPTLVGAQTASLVTLGVTGDPALMYEELESVADGIGLSMGASMVAVIILLLICYVSLRKTEVTLVAIVTSLGLALGFAAVALGPLNLVSVAFVVPLVGLGLDFAIHVTTRASELERRGTPSPVAYVETGRGIALALGLSAFTTAAAFISFVGTDFVGMGQVGIIGSVGVLIAFVVALTLVPALAVLGRQPGSLAGAASTPETAALVPAEATMTRRFRRIGTLLLLVLALGSVALAPHVRFDTDPMNLRDPASPSMVALAELMADPDTAPYRISLVGDEATVNAFADRAAEAPAAASVITLSRLVPADQDEKLALFDRFYPPIMARILGEPRLPDAPPDAAKMLADELAARSTGAGSERLLTALNEVAAGMDTATRDDALLRYFPALIERLRAQNDIGPVTADDLPAAITDRFRSPDGLYRAEVAPAQDLADPVYLRRFVDEMVAIDPDVAGAPLEIVRAGEVVSRAMLQATLVAAFVVSLICIVVLRNLRETVSVLLPLAIAGFLLVGAMVVLALPFNYANVIVLPLIIGLGVDSSIHLALRKRELDAGSVFATSTPRAVLFSGLTTVVAFGSLALSSHRGTASMGELLALSIAIVLTTTIVTTPTFLELLVRKHGQ